MINENYIYSLLKFTDRTIDFVDGTETIIAIANKLKIFYFLPVLQEIMVLKVTVNINVETPNLGVSINRYRAPIIN